MSSAQRASKIFSSYERMNEYRNRNINFSYKAKSYDNWYKTALGALCDKLEKEIIFSLGSVRQGESVLDVGCGTGNYLVDLAERGAWVVGVDSSPNMLEIAESKLGKRGYTFQLRLAEAETLPFGDNTFDLVLSVLSLEFVNSPQDAVSEMFRVIKPGGRLVIGTLNKYSLWALKRKTGRALGLAEHVKATYLSKRHLEHLLFSVGSRDLTWRRAIYFPPINKDVFLNFAPLIEKAGHTLLYPTGAFLAVKAGKPSD